MSFTKPTTSTVSAAEDQIRLLQEVHEEIKSMINLEREQAKRNYDLRVTQQPTHNIRDYVLLRSEHIAMTLPSQKLGPKYLGHSQSWRN